MSPPAFRRSQRPLPVPWTVFSTLTPRDLGRVDGGRGGCRFGIICCSPFQLRVPQYQSHGSVPRRSSNPTGATHASGLHDKACAICHRRMPLARGDGGPHLALSQSFFQRRPMRCQALRSVGLSVARGSLVQTQLLNLGRAIVNRYQNDGGSPISAREQAVNHWFIDGYARSHHALST